MEHVGSTSVPDLLAKPIIDLAVAIPAGTALDDVVEPMTRIGWIYRGDGGEHPNGRKLYTAGKDPTVQELLDGVEQSSD